MWIEKGFAWDIPTKLYVDSKHRVSGLCLLSLAMFIRVYPRFCRSFSVLIGSLGNLISLVLVLVLVWWKRIIEKSPNFSIIGPCFCRVVFGSSSLFVLHHPVELDLKKKQGVQLEEISYDLAQEEIAANSGFDMGKGSGQTKST